jgi:co-chaperonin GroES (HSP10)
MNKNIMNRHPRPIGSYILVRLKRIDEEKEVKTDWGFIERIREDSQIKREQRGTKEAYIVAIGEDAPNELGGELGFKIGDLVLIAKYAGDDMDDVVDGEIFRIVNARQIQLVFDGEHLNNEEYEHE